MTTKEKLLQEKLGNFIKFLQDEEGPEFPDEHNYIKLLKSMQTNSALMMHLLLELNKLCDVNGELPNGTLNFYATNIGMGNVDEGLKTKFKRYIQCFIKILRS